MTLTLPTETEQWIADQVRSGRFATPEAVVAAAVDALAADAAQWDETLDAEDLAAIAEADADAERGEVFTPEQVRAALLGPLGRGS